MSDLLIRHLTQLLGYSRANFRERRTYVGLLIFFPRKWMDVLPLSLHQSVHIETC
jgi:hypothetical protein